MLGPHPGAGDEPLESRYRLQIFSVIDRRIGQVALERLEPSTESVSKPADAELA